MALPGVIPVGGGPLEDQVFSAPLTLRRGEVISSGKARLRFQESGDLTVHDEHESERWRSGTDSGAVLAQLRPSGELAVLSAEGEPLWATPTAGHPGATLVARTTGDVEIRSAEGSCSGTPIRLIERRRRRSARSCAAGRRGPAPWRRA